MLDKCLKITQKQICIGGISLRNTAFLAPMSGVTDVPFRQLAWELGAGMVVSEMVASEALTTGQEEMRLKAEGAGLPVHIIQLAGRQPKWMAEATRMAEQAGASIIDINMGCPSKRVTSGYSGSALMRDLDHALQLIEAVQGATSLPITLKMRLGWDENSLNAPELAIRAEKAGVQMITVHGRTRNQFYKGKADWAKISAVREVIDIPLVVNGDIGSLDQARTALKLSGADGVMIGRASYGSPWLPGQIGAALNVEEIPAMPFGAELAAMISRHYEAMLSFYGQSLGIRNARKHLGWYCEHLPKDKIFDVPRRQLMTSNSPAEVLKIIESVFVHVRKRSTASQVAA